MNSIYTPPQTELMHRLLQITVGFFNFEHDHDRKLALAATAVKKHVHGCLLGELPILYVSLLRGFAFRGFELPWTITHISVCALFLCLSVLRFRIVLNYFELCSGVLVLGISV